MEYKKIYLGGIFYEVATEKDFEKHNIKIGDDVIIKEWADIGSGVTIEAYAFICPNATIETGAIIKKNAIISK